MGYSHYWYLDSKDSSSKEYQKAKEEITLVIKKNINILGDGHGEGEPDLSGDIICINGKGDDSHESFYLPERMSLWALYPKESKVQLYRITFKSF